MKLFSTKRKIAVVALGFTVMFLYWGVYYSFTIFYSDLVNSFDSTYAWIGFIATLAYSGGFMLSPVAAWFAMKTSYGTAFFFMGALSAVAYFLTSYDDYYWQLLLTYSAIFAISSSLNMIAYNYFVDNMEGDHDAGLSITAAATGSGVITLGCLATYFMIQTDVTWRTVFRYQSAAGVIILVCGIGMGYFDRSKVKGDLDMFSSRAPSDSESEEVINQSGCESDHLLPPVITDSELGGVLIRDKCGWELFCSADLRPLKLVCMNCLLLFTGIYPISIAVTYGIAVSSDSYMYYYMMIAVGAGNLLCRILTVFLINASGERIGGVGQMVIYQLGCIGSMALLASIPADTMNAYAAVFAIFAYSFFEGGLFPLIVLRSLEILGQENHIHNLNLQFFFIGATMPLGSYLCGAIYDSTSNFQYVFMTVGLFYIVSILLDLLLFPEITIFKKWCAKCKREV